jgi:hypothetical protein
MRRTVELGLVLAVLVGLPLGVALVARSAPAVVSPDPSALPFVKHVLAVSRLTPTRCGWTQNHTVVHCDLKGGGSCDFQPHAGTGNCSTLDGETTFLIIGSDSRGQ